MLLGLIGKNKLKPSEFHGDLTEIRRLIEKSIERELEGFTEKELMTLQKIFFERIYHCY